MKVTKLHIDEYKVFKDFDIDFTDKEGKAQNLIVLAGINGTGKTTLLKFIFNCVNDRHEANGEAQPSYLDVKELESNDTYLNKGIEYTLYFNNPDPDYDEYKNGILFFRVKKFMLSYSMDPIPDNEVVRDFVDYYIYEKNDSAYVGYEALRRDFDKILHDFSIDLKFKFLKGGKTIVFNDLKGNELTLEDLSTGERQILSLVIQLFIANIKDSIILIDEPEFSLHPSWQNKIVGVLQKYADEYNCQVILATHSPHIIGSVKPEQLRLLYKDESGVIKVAEHISNSYGLTFDRVLTDVMGVENLRTPAVDAKLKELSELIKQNEFESPLFKEKMKTMEDLLGYSDGDLILMRFEIAKRKKESAANK